MDQRQDAKPVTPVVERRSALRIAGERLKEFADRLYTNGRWIKKFIGRRK